MEQSREGALRFLFIKHALSYPRASGHDIRCYEMLKALHRLGHQVALATVVPLARQTLKDLDISCFTLSEANSAGDNSTTALNYWQNRFRTYWGITQDSIRAVPKVAGQFDADIVVGLGLEILPFLANAGARIKVWYAADEWIVHHLSQVKLSDPQTFKELRAAAIMGLYERTYASALDRVWVVSAAERRPMQRLAGIQNVDVIANGVDTDFFAPAQVASAPNSAVFWGRLDFGPNIQALEWFCQRIWPEVRRRVPTATLTVMGFNLGDRVRTITNAPGIALIADVPDIRTIVGQNQVAILPMISGGGIKNKLLEAAAMGKAIVCTSRALGGLRSTPPAVVVDDEQDWVEALVRLWASDDERRAIEQSTRRWILEHHTWEAAARDALRGLEQTLSVARSAPNAALAASDSRVRRRSRRDHRVLFVKRSLPFPRIGGHDVHGFELLRALRQAGCPAALATVDRPSDKTIQQLGVPWYSLAEGDGGRYALQLPRWQERFRTYWGVSSGTIEAVAATAAEFDASVVVAVGLDAMPYLAGVHSQQRIWYAADEWVLHHLSQVHLLRPSTYGEVRSAVVKGFYERAYAQSIDRAWVVSRSEQRAMRMLAGVRHVDVIPNGVDFDYFTPTGGVEPLPNSVVFWGRLDFGPNIQGLQWFCDRVWPALIRQVPSATFTIMGFRATDEIRELARRPGIRLRTDVTDLRPAAAEGAVVALPLVSGGGIKNKLLEAAAMGSAIVCTDKACSGLRTTPPVLIANEPREWVDAIVTLWRTPSQRERLRSEVREWAITHHSWRAAADDALAALDRGN